MTEKILIVGGVAGGMSAATRLRRLQEKAEIIVFEKRPYSSWFQCDQLLQAPSTLTPPP